MKTKLIIPRTLNKIGWRYLLQHRLQSGLMILSIALGVSIVIGVDLANESAIRGFILSTKAITGNATHFISAGSAGIEESRYTALRRSGLEVHAAPVITDYVTVPRMEGVTLQLLGVDPFAETPFRNYLTGSKDVPVEALTTFLSKPNSILISSALADSYDIGHGAVFEIEFSGKMIQVSVSGLLEPADNLSRRFLDGIILVDIATAQEITGRLGKVDRIDLIIPEENEKVIEDIQDLLPPGILVLPTETKSSIVKEMTSAFQLNLTAFSLLALVVSLFLIYNTMTFSVIKRRPLFGTLRSLGTLRREIFLLVISEAFLIGSLGTVLGIIFGLLMGRGTIHLVSQTINDLFFVTTVRDIPIPVNSIIKGSVLGVLATVVTAAFPAWEAASVQPRSALSRANLESKANKVIRLLGIVGIIFVLSGVLILIIPSDSLELSFLGTFITIIGIAMFTPSFTIWIMTSIQYLTSKFFGAVGRMAPREVISSISRTSVAVAALMIAISVTIGVSLMVNSFRYTVETWLNQILHGDIYVSIPGAMVSQPLQPIDPMVIKKLENWEGVVRVDLLQNAIVDSPDGPIQISANNNPNDGMEQIYLSADYPPEEIWEAVNNGSILVSEPLANRLNIPLQGGELQLYTKYGLNSFPIVGIYYDYASSEGSAILSLANYQQLWDDNQISAAALILDKGIDADTISQNISQQLAPIQSLLVRPNKELKAETLEVFDRTFAIIGTLQLITTAVAFVGVMSAIMSLQLDKQRELGILKAIGLSPRQLWFLVTLETGLMGSVASILAMPTGFILAVILIFIINRRSFGWTLQMQISPGPFIFALLIGIIAGLLASIYPAQRIINRNTAEAVRFD